MGNNCNYNQNNNWPQHLIFVKTISTITIKNNNLSSQWTLIHPSEFKINVVMFFRQ